MFLVPYENLPIQYTELFSALKIEKKKIIGKKFNISLVLLKTLIAGTRQNRLDEAVLTVSTINVLDKN